MRRSILSDIELYYSQNQTDNFIRIDDEETHHIINVMRHKIGDKLFVTDGKGYIFTTAICNLEKKKVVVEIIQKENYKNILSNYVFCIPRLKNSERFEFALEKCVELGITNFLVFDSDRSIARGDKSERWKKILISAMKQSLRAWLPNVEYCKTLEELTLKSGKKIFFDQKGDSSLIEYLSNVENKSEEIHYFVFGPEGGYSNEEYEIIRNEQKIRLTENRLRSETAIITTASLLAMLIQ